MSSKISQKSDKMIKENALIEGCSKINHTGKTKINFVNRNETGDELEYHQQSTSSKFYKIKR